MTRLRAVAAALLLLTIVGGVPVALWLWGVSPLRLADLARPDDGSAVLAGLTVAGWLAWAAFVLSVLAEAVNLIGRRSSPLRIPLLGGFQSLVGALVVAVLSATAAPAMAAVPAVQPTGTKTAVGLPAEEDDSRDVVDETTSYRVRPGDDLWSVAEQLLGQGSRWRLLADANPALLANPTVDLTPGVRLVVPELPDEPDVAAPETGARRALARPEQRRAASPLTVVVKRGDTLSGLAEEHLGAAAKWPRIFRANKDRIKDPDAIDVGWQLVIPARAAAAPEPGRHRPVRKQNRLPQGQSIPQTQQPGEPTAPAPEAQPTPDGTPQTSAATASGSGWSLVGGLSGAAAAMILVGLGLNRLDQLRARPLGRRINHPPVDLRRYETALGRRERPDTTALLETALRALGAWAHAAGRCRDSRWPASTAAG